MNIVPRVNLQRQDAPLQQYGLERQLENITSHKVGLPSGGNIVINPTKARLPSMSILESRVVSQIRKRWPTKPTLKQRTKQPAS